MGLTTALFTSLSGMNANAQAITVTGNNIANVNTTGFKTSRASFETQISQTLAAGSAPSSERGGTNPTQIGLGTRIGSVSRDFSTGSLQPTGINTDIAIEGSGFFILQNEAGVRYTRAGTFQLDRDFKIVSPDGGRVQGFGVDSEFNVIEGVLGDVVVPIGSLTLAQATRTVQFAGNLNAGGDPGTVGAMISSDAIFADDAASTSASDTDMLTTLFTGAGTKMFEDGDVITFTGAQKGGATLTDHTFEVGETNTTESETTGQSLGDLLTFIEQVLGIDAAVSGGVTLSGGGQIIIEGNTGTANDLKLENANLIVNQATNPLLPFNFSKLNSSDGESVRTTFLAFDSLGTPLTIDMNVVLEEKTNAGTTWRFYVQSEDDTELDRVLGNGTIAFDTNGQLLAMTDSRFVIDRTGTGAFTPQQMSVDFGADDGSVSSLTSTQSQISAVVQDGSPIGTLEDFSIGEDGEVIGIFSNSLLQSLGQITLAQFSNPQGLEDVGGNLYRSTINSGTAAVVAPGSGGSGRLVGGALELSNVELSQEFISLINASTGFTANSRVLTTSDRLIQELLAVIR